MAQSVGGFLLNEIDGGAERVLYFPIQWKIFLVQKTKVHHNLMMTHM